MRARDLLGLVGSGLVFLGLGCASGGPAATGPAPASPPVAQASEPPAVTEACPPRMIDLPEGGRLPATLAAIGTAEGDKWVTFELLDKPGDDGRAAGRWLSWTASGAAEQNLGEGPDALIQRLRKATGREAIAQPRKEKKAIAAITRGGAGAAEHRVTLLGYTGTKVLEGDYACAAAGASGPLTLAEARALLPALVPEGMPEIVAELLGGARIALIEARLGYTPGGEARYDVIADAAWRQSIEARLAAVAGETLKFTVGAAPGTSYLHEEPGWKIDVYAIPEKKQIHVEVDWE